MVAVLKPFGARVGVLDPPRERVLASGLIVISHEFRVDTGIIIELPPPHPMIDEIASSLKRGFLIFYIKDSGVRISDVTMVPLEAIIAIEHEEEESVHA